LGSRRLCSLLAKSRSAGGKAERQQNDSSAREEMGHDRFLLGSRSARIAEKARFAGVGDYDRRGKPDEKAMFDNSRNGCERPGERLGIRDRSEGTIQYVVAAIGDKSMALRSAPESDVGR
jgi:hypothetical protein